MQTNVDSTHSQAPKSTASGNAPALQQLDDAQQPKLQGYVPCPHASQPMDGCQSHRA